MSYARASLDRFAGRSIAIVAEKVWLSGVWAYETARRMPGTHIEAMFTSVVNHAHILKQYRNTEKRRHL